MTLAILGYLWAIVEESIHSISGGFPSLVLDEGYTNILVRRIAREEILSESEYYDFLHYPIMQEAVNHLIRVVGEEGIALSYFTGDERYIKHTFGKNGELILSLLYALDDFYISGMGIFELDVEEIIRLIFENIHSEKNLKIIGNILILRYRYWKKSEYGDENKEIILKEIERLKGMLEKQPYLSYDISWSIFRDELRNLLEQSNNPFLVEIIRRLLSEEVKSRDILTDSLPDKEIFKGI